MKIVKIILGLLITLQCISVYANDYMQYPAMQHFIKKMSKQGFSHQYLHQTFSKIKRDNRILELVNSPAEAKPWF